MRFFPGFRRQARALSTLALLLPAALLPGSVAAQSVDGTGTVATGLLLRQMEGVKRVLMIGAHPDDEDTGFLTMMARGLGAETAYLALTRGDGGQNLIGPELWEGLGVIRTGELEAARAIDGGRQFFTRAVDFGFSKSADESLARWPREELLADVVWVVRTYRPHVIVSVFSGTPRDGHGQHQAAGIMAREAFAAAGDPTRFPDQLGAGVEAWSPQKFYQTSRRRFLPDAPQVDGEIVLPIGGMDPLLGRSSFQLSMESRSQHRSQDMGAPQPPGPRSTSVILVDARVPDAGESVFSGIDTTLVGLAVGLPDGVAAAVRRDLEAYGGAVGDARARFGLDPSAVVPDLADALRHLRSAANAAGSDASTELALALEQKLDVATRALMAASGVVFDVRSADDIVVPGESVQVTATLWNGGAEALALPRVEVASIDGWPTVTVSVSGLSPDGTVAPGTLATWTFEVSVPDDATPSRLYYLEAARDGDLYAWPDDPELWGLPRDPADVVGTVSFVLGSVREPSSIGLEAARPWRYVGVDQARGEFVKPVLVLPALSVAVTPSGIAWPQGRSEPSTLNVILHAEAQGGVSGSLSLAAPEGWTISPESVDFDLGAPGSERSVAFGISPSGALQAGEHVFEATATVQGRTFSEAYAIVDYDHIPRSALFGSASAEVTVVPVVVREGLDVGYIMGTGDAGPEAIRQMGANVELVTEEQVRDGDFSAYDVLVLGVRAYEARADVRAANEQILDFARAGGTVVNQYNQYQFSQGGYGPDGITINLRPQPRVAIETQPVTVLEPEAPVFTTPNRIDASDFDGWVQERGLYFPNEWGDGYVPMLEMNDPGEDPQQGSLLVTSVGDGVYVYTALSFFRQWADRVPGAYRLFANLISLDAESWRAFTRTR